MQNKNLPLSPHLQVYRWYFTMFLSILHRATGFALSAGALLLCGWLLATASGEYDFHRFHECLSHPIGQLMLIGWLYSFVFHFLNGLRHLVWDTGYWLEKKSAAASGYAVFFASMIVTLALWLFAKGFA